MSVTATVGTSPIEDRQYDNMYGTMVVWKFNTPEHGVVELHKKPGNAPPAQGTVLEGTIEEREFRGDIEKRFKVLQQRGGGSSGPSNGGGWQRDPKDTKQIVRQHSQDMAIRFVQIAVEKDLIKVGNEEELWVAVRQYTDRFDFDVLGAVTPDKPPQSETQTPADTAGMKFGDEAPF